MKLRKTELLLIAAPIVVAAAFALVKYTGVLRKNYSDAREYGADRPLRVIRANGSGPVYLGLSAWSPDGRLLAGVEMTTQPVTSTPVAVHVWEAAGGRRLSTWPEKEYCNRISFSSDSRQVLVHKTRTRESRDVTSGQLVEKVSASNTPFGISSTTQSWTGAATQALKSLPGAKYQLTITQTMGGVELNEKSATPQFYSLEYDVEARPLQSKAGGRKFRLASFVNNVSLYGAMTDFNLRAVGSADRTLLFTSTLHPEVQGVGQKLRQSQAVFDVAAGKALWEKDEEETGYSFMAAAFSDDHTQLAYLSQQRGQREARFRLEIRSVRTGALQKTLHMVADPNLMNTSESLSFSPDGKRLAVRRGAQIEIWDLPGL